MKKMVILFGLILTIMAFCSCTNTSERARILLEIKEFKKELPFKIPNSNFVITDMELDGDMVVYTCTIPQRDWETMPIASELSNDDRNLARILASIPDDVASQFMENNLGIKYIYVSRETSIKLLEVKLSADKLKEIKKRVDNGELKAFSFLEVAKMEVEKMKTVQLEEGIWLTDVYMEGNNIYYVITLFAEVNPTMITSTDLAQMKTMCIDALRQEGLVMMHKNELVQENVHFVYIYKDSRGIEVARIDIAPREL